jgi:hypothetical protein
MVSATNGRDEMRYRDVELKINSGGTIDRSAMAIDMISKLMDFLQADLSKDGKDYRAVYSWFVERYRPGVILTKDMMGE